MVDVGLYIGYGLFLITVGAAIVLPLINALKSPKDLGKSLVGVAALLVLFLVAFAMAGSEVSTKYVAKGINESSSKIIGAGLSMFYVVFIVALIGILYSEINKALK